MGGPWKTIHLFRSDPVAHLFWHRTTPDSTCSFEFIGALIQYGVQCAQIQSPSTAHFQMHVTFRVHNLSHEWSQETKTKTERKTKTQTNYNSFFTAFYNFSKEYFKLGKHLKISFHYYKWRKWIYIYRLQIIQTSLEWATWRILLAISSAALKRRRRMMEDEKWRQESDCRKLGSGEALS